MATNKNEKETQKQYKMADIEQITGVGRETIRFYIGMGLLPKPIKTSKNMAWYYDEHIDLIRCIRSLQQDQFLPLKAIKSILHGHTPYEFSDKQVKLLVGLKNKLNFVGTVHGRGMPGAKAPPKVTQSHLTQLREMGWISGPNEKLTSVDHEIIDLWSELLETGIFQMHGLEPKHINYVLEAADFMLDKELTLFQEHSFDLSAKDVLSIIRSAHLVTNRLFSVLHLRRFNKFAAQLETAKHSDT